MKKYNKNHLNYILHEGTPNGVKNEIKKYVDKKNSFLGDLLSLLLYPKKRYDGKIFILNSGSCASTYLAELLKENGISEVYHNKPPSMDYSGVKKYLEEESLLAYLLIGLSRINVNVEVSHNIFSFSRKIKKTYPKSKFIHLYRSGIDSVRSTVNKVLFPEVFNNSTRIRYSSKLAGKKELDPFSRACKYWANINRRIMEDLEAMEDSETAQLRFRDVIDGNLECVEEFLGRSLPIKTMDPVNTKENLKDESAVMVGDFSNWPTDWQRKFARICGPVHERLGYEMPEVDL